MPLIAKRKVKVVIGYSKVVKKPRSGYSKAATRFPILIGNVAAFCSHRLSFPFFPFWTKRGYVVETIGFYALNVHCVHGAQIVQQERSETMNWKRFVENNTEIRVQERALPNKLHARVNQQVKV